MFFASKVEYIRQENLGMRECKVNTRSPLQQGFANKLLRWISVSVLRVFALVAFVSTRFPSITIVYFTFPKILRKAREAISDQKKILRVWIEIVGELELVSDNFRKNMVFTSKIECISLTNHGMNTAWSQHNT